MCYASLNTRARFKKTRSKGLIAFSSQTFTRKIHHVRDTHMRTNTHATFMLCVSICHGVSVRMFVCHVRLSGRKENEKRDFLFYLSLSFDLYESSKLYKYTLYYYIKLNIAIDKIKNQQKLQYYQQELQYCKN